MQIPSSKQHGEIDIIIISGCQQGRQREKAVEESHFALSHRAHEQQAGRCLPSEPSSLGCTAHISWRPGRAYSLCHPNHAQIYEALVTCVCSAWEHLFHSRPTDKTSERSPQLEGSQKTRMWSSTQLSAFLLSTLTKLLVFIFISC